VGGDPGQSSKIMAAEDSRVHFNNWFESVNKTFVFCGFTKRSLVPIWNLCEREERRKVLQDYFPIYALKFDIDEDIKKPI
jgi:hypothetical protein